MVDFLQYFFPKLSQWKGELKLTSLHFLVVFNYVSAKDLKDPMEVRGASFGETKFPLLQNLFLPSII